MYEKPLFNIMQDLVRKKNTIYSFIKDHWVTEEYKKEACTKF